MLAEMKPGRRFITSRVAATSRSTRCCWRSGATVNTLTSVTRSRSVEMWLIALSNLVSMLISYQHAYTFARVPAQGRAAGAAGRHGRHAARTRPHHAAVRRAGRARRGARAQQRRAGPAGVRHRADHATNRGESDRRRPRHPGTAPRAGPGPAHHADAEGPAPARRLPGERRAG